MPTDQVKLLENLKGLQSAGMELPEHMCQKLAELEAMAKDQAAAPLSHSHLNKWTKLRNQLRTQQRKVRDLDSSWMSFLRSITEKVQTHAAMYQACRAELLDGLALKKLELAKVREMITSASQTLLEEQEEEKVDFAMTGMQESLDQFLQMTDAMAAVTDLDDEDVELVEVAEQDKEIVREGRRKMPVHAFSHKAPTSPSKVAPTISKNKPDK